MGFGSTVNGRPLREIYLHEPWWLYGRSPLPVVTERRQLGPWQLLATDFRSLGLRNLIEIHHGDLKGF
jgi:hypothetical protein